MPTKAQLAARKAVRTMKAKKSARSSYGSSRTTRSESIIHAENKRQRGSRRAGRAVSHRKKKIKGKKWGPGHPLYDWQQKNRK